MGIGTPRYHHWDPTNHCGTEVVDEEEHPPPLRRPGTGPPFGGGGGGSGTKSEAEASRRWPMAASHSIAASVPRPGAGRRGRRRKPDVIGS